MDFIAVPAGTAPVAALALRGADPSLSFATGDSFNTTLGATLCVIPGAAGQMEAAYSNVAGELVGALFTSDPAVLDTATILAVISPLKMRVAWLQLLARPDLTSCVYCEHVDLGTRCAQGARSGSERSRESVIGHVVPTAGHIRISVVDCRPPWTVVVFVCKCCRSARGGVRHASVEATVSYNQQTTLISLSIEDASTLLVLPQYMSEPNVTLPT